MDKLKTLQDLENEVYRRLDVKRSFNTFQMIKQEAIKWIKSYRSWDKEINGNVGEDIAIQFMLFFNITEEDLNNE